MKLHSIVNATLPFKNCKGNYEQKTSADRNLLLPKIAKSQMENHICSENSKQKFNVEKEKDPKFRDN